MQQTTNYVLNKPEQTDVVNIDDLNANFDTLDVELKKVSNKADSIVIPTSLPANGGNADTVNNHTVESDVPANAKFTDTVYIHPSFTPRTSGLYKITVDAKGHITAVTPISKEDITELGIPAQDTTYTHPSYTSRTSGLYKITVDTKGHVNSAVPVSKSDITALGIPGQDTTYSSLPANGGNSDTVDNKHIVVLSQAQYDALPSRPFDTIYLTT